MIATRRRDGEDSGVAGVGVGAEGELGAGHAVPGVEGHGVQGERGGVGLGGFVVAAGELQGVGAAEGEPGVGGVGAPGGFEAGEQGGVWAGGEGLGCFGDQGVGVGHGLRPRRWRNSGATRLSAT